MSHDRNTRWILRGFALVAIVVGVLSLLGVRPMNSRTIEVILGTASLLAGLILFVVTRPTSSPAPTV